MHNKIAGLMLGLALCAGAAQAGDSITTTSFSIATLDSYDPLDLQVLSDTGGTVSVSMGGFLPDWDLWVEGGMWSPSVNEWFNRPALQFDVRDGYRITSLTLSANVTGALHVDAAPPGLASYETPFATNGLTFQWTIGDGADTYAIGGKDFVGSQAFSGTVAQSIEGQSVLSFYNLSAVSAMGYQGMVCTDHCWYANYDASASLRVSDIVMTVQIAAVPEPSTYAMLLGGLALVGAAARRRKQH